MSNERAQRRRQQRDAAKAHPAEHCYHQFAPAYGMQISVDLSVPAVPEFCCWCAPVRLTVFRDAPADANEHGSGFRFVGLPKPAPAPVSQILVPGRPALVH